MSGIANRRALLASGLAAAVLAASGMPVRAAPRPGGDLRVAVPAAGGVFDAAVALATGETLTEIGPDGGLHAGIASAWAPRDGAAVWEIELRDDVRFHDGAPMTGQDAIAALAPVIAGAALIAPFMVNVALAAPDPDFPLRLADPALTVRRGALGTGLYVPVQISEGERFVGRRVARHWKDGRAGWLDRVDILGLDPAEARLSALRRGRVDAASGLGAHAAGILRAGAEHELEPEGEGGTLFAAAIGLGRTPGAGLEGGRFAERWWRA